MASLEPKLFCSVAFKERFRLMRTHGAIFRTPTRLLRHNNVKRLMSYDIQPDNASAPQNQLQRCSWGIRPESETGDYTGALYRCQAQAAGGRANRCWTTSQKNHFNR